MNESNVNYHKPGFVSLLFMENSIFYEHSTGVEKKGCPKPITRNTIFDLASVSKQFTAFCLLLLERDELLSLKDPLCIFVPEVKSYAGDVRLCDLIYHVSGIPDFVDIALSRGVKFEDRLSSFDILNILAEQAELRFPPGSKFEYSNSGYFLLSLVISRVSGISFTDYAQNYIFRPLGMNSTFILDGMSSDERVATGYAKDENGNFFVSRNPWGCMGASLVHSSASDLMKWASNFFSAEIGGPGLLKKMLTPLPKINEAGSSVADHVPYCFGLSREEGRLGIQFCHEGGTAGFSTYFACSIEKRYAVTVLSNIEDHDVEQVADEICSVHGAS